MSVASRYHEPMNHEPFLSSHGSSSTLEAVKEEGVVAG